tara:strand:+ start:202 stop:375 length:174 start_codon:yes stop_codon:yes gene_type:complete
MSNTESPFMSCEKCGGKFSWVYVDTISEGEIYECEFCNNIFLKRNEQEQVDVVRYDN